MRKPSNPNNPTNNRILFILLPPVLYLLIHPLCGYGLISITGVLSSKYLRSNLGTCQTDRPSIKDTLKNPRRVASLCGSPTIRDPFGNAIEISFAPSPRTLIPSRLTNSSALRTNSPLCLALGDSTSIRLSGWQYARCTAFAAATVDLPHCRVQFTMPRRPPRSTNSCKGFGSKPSRCRVNSTISGISSDLPSVFPIKVRPFKVRIEFLPVTHQGRLI